MPVAILPMTRPEGYKGESEFYDVASPETGWILGHRAKPMLNKLYGIIKSYSPVVLEFEVDHTIIKAVCH